MAAAVDLVRLKKYLPRASAPSPQGEICKNAAVQAGGQSALWPGWRDDCRARVRPKRLMHGREPGEAPGKSYTNVFLAYATEDETIARTMTELIEGYSAREKDCEVHVKPWPWAPEVGQSILDNILSKMKECRFGIFLLSPLDKATSGDSSRLKARDNVVLEAGLFIGKKDSLNAFLLLPEGYGVAPSDLAGIIGIPYGYDGAKANTRDERHKTLWPPCEKIVDRIQDVMDHPSLSRPLLSSHKRRGRHQRALTRHSSLHHWNCSARH